MKSLRTIVYKTLVDNLGVSANMLSRIEGDKPIEIELNSGAVIFVFLNNEVLQASIEIPFRDNRVVQTKSGKVIEALLSDKNVFLNVTDNKLIMLSEVVISTNNVEKVLADKIKLFNNVADHIIAR